MDLERTADDHAAIHDCDTGILHDIRVAAGLCEADPTEPPDAATARCVALYHEEFPR